MLYFGDFYLKIFPNIFRKTILNGVWVKIVWHIKIGNCNCKKNYILCNFMEPKKNSEEVLHLKTCTKILIEKSFIYEEKIKKTTTWYFKTKRKNLKKQTSPLCVFCTPSHWFSYREVFLDLIIFLKIKCLKAISRTSTRDIIEKP